MSSPRDRNERLLLTLWGPVIAATALGIVAFAMQAPSKDGNEIYLVGPLGVAVAFGFVFVTRTLLKRKVAAALRSPTPEAFRSVAYSNRAGPYGIQLSAANVANVCALYGRVDEAEAALASVSWDECPPIVLANRSAARALMAYARGELGEGRVHAIRATEEGEVPSAAPGGKTSAIAFRTHVDLGRALEGRATAATVKDLEEARATLPLLGQIVAEWALGAAARDRGDEARLAIARAFVVEHAPYFAPVLQSLDEPSESTSAAASIPGALR